MEENISVNRTAKAFSKLIQENSTKEAEKEKTKTLPLSVKETNARVNIKTILENLLLENKVTFNENDLIRTFLTNLERNQTTLSMYSEMEEIIKKYRPEYY